MSINRTKAYRYHVPPDGATENIRMLAADVLEELRLAGNKGLERRRFKCSAWASQPSIFRAITWLRRDGVVVEHVQGQGFRLHAGSKRTMSAAALARVDLLDELQRLVGTRGDPLEAVAQLAARRSA